MSDKTNGRASGVSIRERGLSEELCVFLEAASIFTMGDLERCTSKSLQDKPGFRWGYWGAVKKAVREWKRS
jgi:hypothetical protein